VSLVRRFQHFFVTAAVLASVLATASASRANPRPRAAPLDAFTLAAWEAADPHGTLDVVVSLDRVASPALEHQLAGLAVWSAAFHHVPAAGLRIPVQQLESLRRVPGVRGVYLDRRLRFDTDDSHRLLNTGPAEWAAGVTGHGVTIAVLDTGVDFTHPDLAPAMRANVKMAALGEGGPVVPLSDVPNSDTSSGHGTHVAGVAAGRGTASEGRHRGIAPGADLVGVGTGEAISIFNVVEGFDWILGHKDQYGIRIVTNSWGTGFAPFDPADPIQVATKTVAAAGIVVLFAMGNDGHEMTMNPYAAAPWVIPVAAGSQAGGVTDFSSGGIEADTLSGAFAGAEVQGDPRRPFHLGLYHPSVTAPGEDIVSTRARSTILPALALSRDAMTLPPADVPWYTTMSGTSMATPEIAGLAALVLEADPGLTPPEVRSVLEVTARPIPGVPFHKQGYGYADASAAVELARSLRDRSPADAGAALDALQAQRDRQVLGGLDHPSTTLAFADPVPGLAAEMSHPVMVPEGSRRLKVVFKGPEDAPLVGSVSNWELTVSDASGRTVDGSAAMTERSPSGATTLDLSLRPQATRPPPAWGTWRLTLRRIMPVGAPVGGPPADDVAPRQTMAMVAAVFGAS